MFRSVARLFVARPRASALLVVLVVFAGAAAGGYAYALARWRTAESALRQGRLDEARHHLAFCLKVWPRSPAVHLRAARAARLAGEYPLAEAHLTTAKSLLGEATEPVQLEFLLMRAQTGEVDEVAADLFRFVDAGHADTPAILETIARAFMRELRYGPAFSCLNRWVELEPDSPKPYHWRGWVVERLNNPKQALVDYKKAVELDPDHFAARLRVAEMHLEDKQPLEARPHLELLRLQHPDRPEVQARLGQCLFLQGERQEARRLLEAARESMPDDGPLLTHLARLEIQEGRPKQAEGHLRHLLKVDPGDSEAWFTLVAALQAQGRRQDAAAALAHYEKLKSALERANKLLRSEAEKGGTDAAAAAQIGLVLLEVGQERIGLHWLHEALRRDPAYAPAHRALSDHYTSKGDAARAAHHRRLLPEPEKKGKP